MKCRTDSSLALVVVGVSLALAPLLPGCRAVETHLPGRGGDAGRTVLYRDTWGVAHIYAPTVTAGLYAQGWAQAEDRPEQLLLNLLMGVGEYATAVGREGLESDVAAHTWNHYEVAQAHLDELSPAAGERLAAFARGINDYYAAHPEDVPPWWVGRQVDPAMIAALGRWTSFAWTMNEAFGDLRRGGIEAGPPPDSRGSNQFAIAPSRSAEGAAILASDPHVPWHGQIRWWEVRMHAGELEGSGVSMAGSPYIAIGHTRHLAWSFTTGGPDMADVYELVLDDERPYHYRYDGEWRPMVSRRLAIEVRDGGTENRTVWFSHHGPIIAWAEGRAYAAKIANADVTYVDDLIIELNFGTDYRAARRGLQALTLASQNVMVADSSGNIYYQRAGKVPRRPGGYDWSVPVDGSTSATEWLGFHASSEHLEALNPPQGYLQNCNVPPDAMMVGSPFAPASDQGYLYASRAYGELSGWTNQRGARALELLVADPSVTAEEAIAIVNDLEPYGADRWIEALRRADTKASGDSTSAPAYRTALDHLLAWNRELAAGSAGALVYDSWRRRLLEDLGEERLGSIATRIDDWYAVVEGESPGEVALQADDERALIAALVAASREMEGRGDLGAVYGSRYRVGRGDRSWPVGGGREDALLGLSTLRAVRFSEPREDGTRWGEFGQSSTQVVVLSDPARSWIYVPFGQSDRPESPHYDDQAAGPFSQRELKPSWWLPEDLAVHVESRTVLEGAGGGGSAEGPRT